MTTTDDPIEPLTRPEDAAPVRTAEDLRRRWRSLLGHGGFGGHSVWVTWFDGDGRQAPVVMPIDELPDELDELFLTNLMQIVGRPAESMPGSTVAMCLTRPGDRQVTPRDRCRARALIQAACAGDVPLARLHLATPDSVRPLTLDDLGG